MNYKQLSLEERHTIDISFNIQKSSITKIAKNLRRSKYTISREIKRNSVNGIYSYSNAIDISHKRSMHKYAFRQLKYTEFNRLFLKYYNKRVKLMWVRPKTIDLKLEQGHWEVNLMVDKKTKGYANLLTLTERKSRINLIRKVYSKNPMKINSEIYEMIKENDIEVKSITSDNGIKFEKIRLLAKWVDCIIYKCEPYASHQRGSNENANGIVHRFWKKGYDFTNLLEENIYKVQEEINNMPRVMFG